MKEIKLHGKRGNGLIALVDDADYELVNQCKWGVTRAGDNYYATVTVNKRTIQMHRLIMNPPAGMQIDHVNHNGLDNTRSNLRICTQSQNMRNRKKSKNARSAFIGVYMDRKKWRADIKHNGARFYIGAFDTEEEAARARDKKAIEIGDEFFALNFPKG